ncbi:MAG TPA: radical SAM family heme chaperone HemW [Bacillota bacterium]
MDRGVLDRGRLGPGLYVHIPFCARKCHYCDFTAYHHRPARASRYIDDLIAEIGLYAHEETLASVTFRTVFFGGGTPSLLEPADFHRLLAALRSHFRVEPGAEVSLEANPEDLSAERLAAWREAGVNRLSIGAQAAQPGLLAALGRLHDWEAVATGFARARQEGFDNISVDLMFGLPGQTLDDWRETLDRVLDLAPGPPEHLSCYGLQVEEGTLFGRRRREGRLRLPPDEVQAAKYRYAVHRLSAAGFEHYEISNFARPGLHSRHNLNYWADGDFLGLGAGAWSHWDGRRWGNERYLRPYGEAVAGGRRPVVDTDQPGERTRMADALMLGTRLVEGMPAAWFVERFGLSPQDAFGPELAELAGRGLLEQVDGRVRLTRRGLLLANEVWAALL